MSNSIRNQTSWSLRLSCIGIVTILFYASLRYVATGESARDELTIYTYSDMLSPEVFEDFEKETGIHVNIKYFEAVEEILTKLTFSQGGDIDIIAPTDAVTEILRNKSLLQPLDKRKLKNISELDMRFMGHYFDPENEHTVPFCWSTVGIGYDSRVITVDPSQIGWDLIFGSETESGFMPPSRHYGPGVGKVCVGEDPWETLFLASIYKYGNEKSLHKSECQQGIIDHLRAQKGWLECHTNNLRYFLISGVSHAVAMPAAYMIQMQEEYPWGRYVIPREGSILFICNLAISKTSQKAEKAHLLIDYLISREGGLACFESHAYNPANKLTYEELPEAVKSDFSFFPKGDIFSKLFIMDNETKVTRIEQIWHQIKI